MARGTGFLLPRAAAQEVGVNGTLWTVLWEGDKDPNWHKTAGLGCHVRDNHMTWGVTWVLNDGGREAAGYKGMAGDCVRRAIAIAAEQPYQKVYDDLNALAMTERPGSKRRGGRRSSSRNGPALHGSYWLAMGAHHEDRFRL